MSYPSGLRLGVWYLIQWNAPEPFLAEALAQFLHTLGLADNAVIPLAVMTGRSQPDLWLDIQAIEYRRRLAGDRASLVFPQSPPGPINQCQVVADRDHKEMNDGHI